MKHNIANPPRHGDGRYSEYLSSAPEQGLVDERETITRIDQFVEKAVTSRARSFYLDKDVIPDLRQQAMEALLKDQQRRGRLLDLESEGGLIRDIVRKVMINSRQVTGFVSSLDYQAQRMLAEELDALRKNGVAVTPDVENETAERIRTERFKAGDRPTIGFQHKVRVSSLDAPAYFSDAAETTTLGDTLPAPETEYVFADDDTSSARLIAAYQNGEVTFSDVRKDLWDAVAASSGAPAVRRDSVHSHTAVKYRAVVSAHPGGVAGMVSAWESGELDESGEAALFAAFGPQATNKELEKAASVLRKNPAYADDIWNCALLAATNRGVDTTR